MEMIDRFREHKYYSRNIKISLILSELLIISVFLLSPKITYNKIIEVKEPIFLIEDIPITFQAGKYLTAKPKVPQIFILGEINEPIILDDVVIDISKTNETTIENEVANAIILNSIHQQRSPTQLLEVLPDKKNLNYNGSLQLKLKIDKHGKVAEHIILFNSMNCDECLKEIILAVYGSVWEPGINNGSETEFWVDKSYTFN